MKFHKVLCVKDSDLVNEIDISYTDCYSFIYGNQNDDYVFVETDDYHLECLCETHRIHYEAGRQYDSLDSEIELIEFLRKEGFRSGVLIELDY